VSRGIKQSSSSRYNGAITLKKKQLESENFLRSHHPDFILL
jgi:hypothetical protein